MKLNIRNTVLIGFAFLSISAFWQMYNNVVPLMLTNTFHMNETLSGVIMAMDNVLALFLLPWFGSLSDKCRWQMGRRKPFILCGTVAAVFLMLMLPLIDNSFFADPKQAKEVLFIIVLGCLLVAMGTYRSPAVALMPDCTPKPLRSKANAIINLMGAVGGIAYLLIASVLYSKKRTAGLVHVDYFSLFAVVAGIMILSLIIIMFFVDEVKLSRQAQAYEDAHPEDNLEVEEPDGREKLPKAVKRSLIFLLFSIALWFIGYNGITTWFTTYASRMWDMSLGEASMCLTVATGGAILAFVPIGNISEKAGRKKVILFGVALLTGCYLAAFIYTLLCDSFHSGLYVLFILVGIAWAMINVNSLPMVLEMCSGEEVGKYTGLYYTFSMAAQIITPIVAGALMRYVGYSTLFPYAAIMTACALFTMSQVKHGDNKIN